MRSLTSPLASLLVVACAPDLTVERVGPAADQGVVVSTPKGIDCGRECSGSFDGEVTLEARVASPFAFLGWEGACSGMGACVVRPGAAAKVAARFVPTHDVEVTLAGDGKGVVRATPPCGAGCRLRIAETTALKLEPVPDEGSVFAAWSGACQGGGACEVVVVGPLKATARFEAAPGTVLATAALELEDDEQLVALVARAGGGALVGRSDDEGARIETRDADGSARGFDRIDGEQLGRMYAMARSRDGGVVAVGSARESDCALVRFGPDLRAHWERALASCGAVIEVAVVERAGEERIVVVGHFGSLGSSLDYEGKALTTKGGTDLFLARYDMNGQLEEVASFGTRASDTPLALAADGERAFIASCAGASCQLSARSHDGQALWQRSYAKAALSLRALVVDGEGGLWVGGSTRKPGTPPAIVPPLVGDEELPRQCGGTHGVLARLDGATGEPALAKYLGATVDALARSGSTVVASGTFAPAVAYGALARVSSAGDDGGCAQGRDGFALALAGGRAEWLTSFGQRGLDAVAALGAAEGGGWLAVAVPPPPPPRRAAGPGDEPPRREARLVRLK